MSKLDRNKPFAEVFGDGQSTHRYEQDGRRFDANGNEIANRAAASRAPTKLDPEKPEPPKPEPKNDARQSDGQSAMSDQVAQQLAGA